MAGGAPIQPSPRPAGSSHILRFQGDLSLQTDESSVQVENATVVSGLLSADVAVPVVFALADMTALDDLTRRLPPYIYDDANPVTSHNVNIGGPSGIGGIAPPSGAAWMQNVRVRAVQNSPTAASVYISRFDVLTPVCTVDGAAGSGLGLEQDTGVPCVTINIHFTASGVSRLTGQGGPDETIPIVVEIEIPHTLQR